MTAESFAIWLNGFLELANPKTLTEKQIQIIKDHLALVFTKVTPYRDKEEENYTKDWNDIIEDYKKQNKPWPKPWNPLPYPYRPDYTYCSQNPSSSLLC